MDNPLQAIYKLNVLLRNMTHSQTDTEITHKETRSLRERLKVFLFGLPPAN